MTTPILWLLLSFSLNLRHAHGTWAAINSKTKSLGLEQKGEQESPEGSKCLAAASPRTLSADSPLPVFLHIPKTGGTSFSIALAQSFETEEILENSCLSSGMRIDEAKNLHEAKIGFGHTTTSGVSKYYRKDGTRVVSPITMFRDVVTQRASYFNEKVDKALYPTPTDWIKSDTFEAEFQLGHVLSTFGNATEKYKDELCNMEFVGLSEKMEDSLCLFSYKFQRRVEMLNSYRVKEDKKRVDWNQDEVEMAGKKSSAEIQMINFVKDMLDARIEAAKADIRKRVDGGQKMDWLCSKWATEMAQQTTEFQPKIDADKQRYMCSLDPKAYNYW
eukprot:CAMPEP_0184503006 /NCGR_PEP_ID=MMETSP0113_2-20130426/51623_1 /TAXON_ID=91329 /ORGANISM="Norrisiella sphaerica, Strain BC52" /LENGTH=330 /DNA_ID=CAMNT_0026892403 /DNA_START=1038 /DNA_END=2027 /DNA_ORIENTATION=+